MKMNDLISRQAAIDALDKIFDSIPMEQTTEILTFRRTLRELPSVQPERKKGAWINDGRIIRCNKCKIGYATVKGMKSALTYNFCPNCGASMREDNN